MLEREQKRPRIGMLDCLWMYEVWLKETEDINTQDTTVCTVLSSPIHLILVLEYRKHGELLSYLRQRAPTATYIDQQSPLTLARYDQVRLASRN